MQHVWEKIKREYEIHKNTRQNISEIIDGNLDKLRLDGNEIKISNRKKCILTLIIRI